MIQLPLPVKALYGLGMIKDAAAKIDHSLPPQQPVQEGVTIKHGRYVANMCIGCHGAQLEGGKIPGTPPEWPAAATLTAAERHRRQGALHLPESHANAKPEMTA